MGSQSQIQLSDFASLLVVMPNKKVNKNIKPICQFFMHFFIVTTWMNKDFLVCFFFPFNSSATFFFFFGESVSPFHRPGSFVSALRVEQGPTQGHQGMKMNSSFRSSTPGHSAVSGQEGQEPGRAYHATYFVSLTRSSQSSQTSTRAYTIFCISSARLSSELLYFH